jgi:hypothetical protein
MVETNKNAMKDKILIMHNPAIVSLHKTHLQRKHFFLVINYAMADLVLIKEEFILEVIKKD